MATHTFSHLSPLIVFLLLLFHHFQSPLNSVASELPAVFDSIYQFGDSYSDTGNLFFERDHSFCSFSPYGETAFGKPFGRCSNGLLIVDYFAMALKLPLLNPYLQKDSDFSHGINFAVAGSTALDASRYSGVETNSSLSVQLRWFKDHLNSVCSSLSAGECKEKLSRTLFLVGETGYNDYNYPLLLAGKSARDLYSIVPEVVQSITRAVEEVVSHGAIHVLVPGIVPIGCLAMFHNAVGSNTDVIYDDLGCLKPLNELASLHNDILQRAIKDLRKQYPEVAIYYGDYYSGYRWILRNAASLGYEKDQVFNSCCGNVTHLCGTEGATTCPDPKKRILWDGIHLTQETYRNMAQWLLSNAFTSLNLNITIPTSI